MAYKKPLCDCGEELVAVTSTMHTNTFKILTNGNQAKKSKHGATTEAE